ncbi:acetyl-CoA hydrolase/transferase C-terminal domain-containing protein [Rhodoferax sp. PAMC 29310]|uniref:acetyl-CoA hydrolase/transferase C-terminal domain-containing protein n=1 Tax=Rhodoferax sp. PAMC 29310 TaxID=2822760 RepID=UPI001B329F58|nr:acetyl-CoA hydrolase/transferase C-terminal domain-containing protein [Rhodoferax sp. PAMC 29310]
MPSNQASTYFVDVETCVDAIIAKVGKHIVFGMPLGLGKPNHLVNALYLRAKTDPGIHLRIMTALSLEVPKGGSDLERTFLKPFVERVWGNYPALAYLTDLNHNKLPPNVEVSEFFMKAGVFLNNVVEQQNYISSNYTHICRDMLENGVNVLSQIVAKKEVDGETCFSLSCNPDVLPSLSPMLRALEGNLEYRCAIIAEVNNNLPFMYNDAIVPVSTFDMVIDNPDYDYTLFSTPNMTVEMTDFMIGMNVSTLVKDGGTLQIGIGSLGDAIAYSIILRDQQNEKYQWVVDDMGVLKNSGDLVSRLGGTGPFSKGLYGSSEMFVNGFLELYKSGILRRKVYDHVVLQRLLNEGHITEQVTPEILEQLVIYEVIQQRLTAANVAFLVKYGIFKPGVRLVDGALNTAGQVIDADLANEDSLSLIAQHCLGAQLKGGVLMHGGFFLGPQSFYDYLRQMSEADNKQICMTTVDNVNHLYGNQELKTLQRKDGRFINTCLMVTLSGGVISDGLEDGRVVSGVGGQYNFVSMAHALQDGRLVMMLNSHRVKDGVVSSNIVWNYGHMTIPRILRDIVVTEYGIANLRSKSDKEIIAALLNIADSRFQPDLLATAKSAGKIPNDYEIPERYRNNTPVELQAKFETYRQANLFPPYPFGNDFTPEELVIGKALKGLKAKMSHKVGTMAGGLFNVIKGGELPEKSLPFLRRMNLEHPVTFKDKMVQSLLLTELLEGGHLE